MDDSRQRIQDDLRGLIAGDVRCDDVFVQMYASDASIHQLRPLGVVRPRRTADVVATVQYAAANKISLHARGAGTGLAGESLGEGLIVDFSRYMRRMIQVDDATVRVQPGLPLGRLNASLRPLGRMFGPDPVTQAVTTLGGVIGVDSGGSHWLRYGSARGRVRELEIVMADGRVLRVGDEPLTVGRSQDPQEEKREVVNRVADLVARNRELIEQHRPRSLVNRSGYHLWDVFTAEHLNLARLLVGSEGTLAFVTEATLATDPIPAHRGVVLLLFDRLENATRAVQEVLTLSPAACDLMDRRHLSLARETDVRFDLLVPPAAEAVLLVEHDGDNPAEVLDRLRQVVDRVCRQWKLAFGFRQTVEPDESEVYWKLARNVIPTLYRVKGATRPVPYVEDFAVPVGVLPSFMVTMQNVLKRHQVTASLFAHAGHGQIHLRPFMDLTNPAQVATLQHLASDLYEAVFEVGGTISGEHGDGLSRTPFLRKQYGPLCDVFRELKAIFDPDRLLNPNKVTTDFPLELSEILRPSGTPQPALVTTEAAPDGETTPREVVAIQLNWSRADFADAARNCNGCGACRSQEAELRMCPIFRAVPGEEASPRAKANLIRGVLAGELPADALLKEDVKAVVDLCVHCHMCRLECAAGVDIPKLMLEARGAFVVNNGLNVSDWLFSRIDQVSSLASSFSTVANWAIGNNIARWLMEKTFGVARGRKLPRWATRNFMRRASRRRLTRPTRRTDRKVLYFVDTYANYHDPQLAEALVAVLEHNGIAVYVPPGQWASGMPLIASGAIDEARKVATHNVAILAEAVRQGYHIVSTEPAAALCLGHEYAQLVTDEDVSLVAANSSDACAYLWKLHVEGQLRLDLKPLNLEVGYHQPCHQRALQIGAPGEGLLRLIPGMTVHRLDHGCSGMAGIYGMKRANYRNSLRAGWKLISAVRGGRWQVGATECCTCKMQMEQGSTKPTIHPLKLLALAYGVMPEVSKLVSARARDLVTS
ncbi:MAG: anaerobic glycerol-3-phosphate dehydrogenase subunit C [Planctomycetia bacterium]|nr:anaerobic glycerol-3-phosphate dehydrogenase subunit C [Planctomycetia bacterium]